MRAASSGQHSPSDVFSFMSLRAGRSWRLPVMCLLGAIVLCAWATAGAAQEAPHQPPVGVLAFMPETVSPIAN